MKNNILATAVALSDRELLARIESLARSERETGAALVAHLAALELRPSLYVAQGYGSLFVIAGRPFACPKTPLVPVSRPPVLVEGSPPSSTSSPRAR